LARHAKVRINIFSLRLAAWRRMLGWCVPVRVCSEDSLCKYATDEQMRRGGARQAEGPRSRRAPLGGRRLTTRGRRPRTAFLVILMISKKSRRAEGGPNGRNVKPDGCSVCFLQ